MQIYIRPAWNGPLVISQYSTLPFDSPFFNAFKRLPTVPWDFSHHHRGRDAFPNSKLLDHNLHHGVWSGWMEGKWLFLIKEDLTETSSRCSLVSVLFSLSNLFVCFLCVFLRADSVNPEWHESQSLSIWIIHIIISLLISWYLEPVFYKTWSENLVVPPTRFTKQQDEPAASYRWGQIEV